MKEGMTLKQCIRCYGPIDEHLSATDENSLVVEVESRMPFHKVCLIEQLEEWQWELMLEIEQED